MQPWQTGPNATNRVAGQGQLDPKTSGNVATTSDLGSTRVIVDVARLGWPATTPLCKAHLRSQLGESQGSGFDSLASTIHLREHHHVVCKFGR